MYLKFKKHTFIFLFCFLAIHLYIIIREFFNKLFFFLNHAVVFEPRSRAGDPLPSWFRHQALTTYDQGVTSQTCQIKYRLDQIFYFKIAFNVNSKHLCKIIVFTEENNNNTSLRKMNKLLAWL